jgi:hypothetical protein
MAGVLKVTVEPEQIRLGTVMFVAADGTGFEVTVKVYGVLVPQELTALTETLPVPEPAVRVIELVVLEPLQPAPLTDHT